MVIQNARSTLTLSYNLYDTVWVIRWLPEVETGKLTLQAKISSTVSSSLATGFYMHNARSEIFPWLAFRSVRMHIHIWAIDLPAHKKYYKICSSVGGLLRRSFIHSFPLRSNLWMEFILLAIKVPRIAQHADPIYVVTSYNVCNVLNILLLFSLNFVEFRISAS